MMKGNKKRNESKVIYGHAIKADGEVTVYLHSLKLGMRWGDWSGSCPGRFIST